VVDPEKDATRAVGADSAASAPPERPAPIVTNMLLPMAVDGVYARTRRYTRVAEGLERYICRLSDARAESLQFPPVMSRSQLEKSGYLGSFPHLLGCVCALHGTEPGIREAADSTDGEWTQGLEPTDLVLTPAACYPLYPLVAGRGRLPPGGLVFDIEAYCFRREPSSRLERLQSFRMREFVRIGSAAQVIEFREQHMAKAPQIAADLGLPHIIAAASDPFFGRAGRIKAVSQLQQALKFELLISFEPAAEPTACMSFNYHRDHFGRVWEIKDDDDGVAHSGCVAFGIDRLTLALFAIHGLDPDAWPAQTLRALSL
jgi:seryl-tRNA synthetase